MTHNASEKRYDDMIYNRCGNSGLLLPAISLGLWHNFGDVDDQETAKQMILRSFDLGVTHFDLANNYGPSPGSAEENFGRIFREELSGYRNELIISTKAGYRMWPGPYGEWGSRKYMLASLDDSLKRMQLEYVDIFYSHRPDPATPIEETMSALPRRSRPISASTPPVSVVQLAAVRLTTLPAGGTNRVGPIRTTESPKSSTAECVRCTFHS